MPSKRRGEPGKYYYVNITEEKGLWLNVQADEPFDPEKLGILITDYVLPDNSTIRLVEPYYANLLDVFGFTNVNVQEDYVIYPDGSRHEIEGLDE